jgi:hypothetical protein
VVRQKGALQKKGVRQFKEFHLQQDEGNLQDEVVLPFKNILMTDSFYQLLPKQATKWIQAIFMFHHMMKVLIPKSIMMLLLIQYLDYFLTIL